MKIATNWYVYSPSALDRWRFVEIFPDEICTSSKFASDRIHFRPQYIDLVVAPWQQITNRYRTETSSCKCYTRLADCTTGPRSGCHSLRNQRDRTAALWSLWLESLNDLSLRPTAFEWLQIPNPSSSTDTHKLCWATSGAINWTELKRVERRREKN